ncbi:MAG: TetR/AcrR family transcriptional regulator [Clostridium sp.]
MSKKLLHKQRVMGYFVDAAHQIIEQEGIENVTIRKTADLAGYNSATLYNYFNNLDHLILFASMKYLKEYVELLPFYLKESDNKLEQYFSIWECFCTCAFKYPKIYYSIFFSDLNEKINNYLEEYYTIFPNDLLTSSSDIGKMLLEKSIDKRNLFLLEDCVNSGLLINDNLALINSITILTFQSTLTNLINSSKTDIDRNALLQETLKYIKYVTLK